MPDLATFCYNLGEKSRLATLITGRQIQYSLDCEELQEAQSKLVKEWPHRLKNHESEGEWVLTLSGYEI